mmetsp:Transcript_33689/g.79948  ORF Transcript_33689/g.79948 Transcript_33689/m.79948 type:complete len:640 (-) Transcript_33689:195-2114(-)
MHTRWGDTVSDEEEDYASFQSPSDTWHESLDVSRGQARQRLNLEHGFLQSIIRNQKDREAYEQAWQRALAEKSTMLEKKWGRARPTRNGEDWSRPKPWRSFLATDGSSADAPRQQEDADRDGAEQQRRRSGRGCFTFTDGHPKDRGPTAGKRPTEQGAASKPRSPSTSSEAPEPASAEKPRHRKEVKVRQGFGPYQPPKAAEDGRRGGPDGGGAGATAAGGSGAPAGPRGHAAGGGGKGGGGRRGDATASPRRHPRRSEGDPDSGRDTPPGFRQGNGPSGGGGGGAAAVTCPQEGDTPPGFRSREELQASSGGSKDACRRGQPGTEDDSAGDSPPGFSRRTVHRRRGRRGRHRSGDDRGTEQAAASPSAGDPPQASGKARGPGPASRQGDPRPAADGASKQAVRQMLSPMQGVLSRHLAEATRGLGQAAGNGCEGGGRGPRVSEPQDGTPEPAESLGHGFAAQERVPDPPIAEDGSRSASGAPSPPEAQLQTEPGLGAVGSEGLHHSKAAARSGPARAADHEASPPPRHTAGAEMPSPEADAPLTGALRAGRKPQSGMSSGQRASEGADGGVSLGRVQAILQAGKLSRACNLSELRLVSLAARQIELLEAVQDVERRVSSGSVPLSPEQQTAADCGWLC